MRRAAVLLGLTLIALAACSGGEADTDSLSSTPDEAAPIEAAATTAEPAPTTTSAAPTTTTEPPVEPGPFIGTWYHADGDDGSEAQLNITSAEPVGNGFRYGFILGDSHSSGCAHVVGFATPSAEEGSFVAASDDVILVVPNAPKWCLRDGPADRAFTLGERTLQLVYDPETETLKVTRDNEPPELAPDCFVREPPGVYHC